MLKTALFAFRIRVMLAFVAKIWKQSQGICWWVQRCSLPEHCLEFDPGWVLGSSHMSVASDDCTVPVGS